ncbi:interleukin-12 subunit alpha-like [Solea senegalensis]|uniref:Interleukin-12 subunit alpha n=1 Tax=Solea senegalensis TaxID=28829 RepID=A0AAV6T772_SOLSE|nr:uncharacterized protein zmp:0000001127 [Solea senegalensis]KAG7525277.1 interleukin-12 subunit alpha-like [Solea senegalensis]
MPLIKPYFTPALVLLVFSSSLWHVAQPLPMKSEGLITESCVLYANTLLQNITFALTQNNLFSGIDCSKQSVELNTETNTPSVCAPKGSTCSGITTTVFDQESCLKNIVQDLDHYYKFLASHLDSNNLLKTTVLFSLREFMENCFTRSAFTDLTLKQDVEDHPSTYDERLSLCKVLKGFQIRTITINRVVGYVHSGDHTKPVLQ